ncbi:hypothetical protein CIB93_30835 [Streptomyces sp. WZ.A104]|uniref:hypothetical protein n=1 Tax=Streptomyces sp. WZ.A104 TaxID=2023771 RepID=UPI000BBBB187|nr:hypothetical protein [Streptomyces sp. WZ.A104]PCG82306.1 hypothetical protein CIB93_30835 [Streptomyces sp. WZ.A104]
MTDPVLYAVEYDPRRVPLPCLKCGVLVEHSSEPLIFAYPAHGPSGVLCEPCRDRAPEPVKTYYLATLAGNITLAAQVCNLMGVEAGPGAAATAIPVPVPALGLDEALRRAAETPEVRAALEQREKARKAASAYLVPAS